MILLLVPKSERHEIAQPRLRQPWTCAQVSVNCNIPTEASRVAVKAVCDGLYSHKFYLSKEEANDNDPSLKEYRSEDPKPAKRLRPKEEIQLTKKKRLHRIWECTTKWQNSQWFQTGSCNPTWTRSSISIKNNQRRHQGDLALWCDIKIKNWWWLACLDFDFLRQTMVPIKTSVLCLWGSCSNHQVNPRNIPMLGCND